MGAAMRTLAGGGIAYGMRLYGRIACGFTVSAADMLTDGPAAAVNAKRGGL